MVKEFKPGKWSFKHQCSENLWHDEGTFLSKEDAEEALAKHKENCDGR